MTKADFIKVALLNAVFTVILHFWGIEAALVFMGLGVIFLLVV